jgi:hypothetical protein
VASFDHYGIDDHLGGHAVAAGFYKYSLWEAMPVGARAAYIAGAYDSFVTFAQTEEDQTMSVHYINCVRQSKMNIHQLADNVIAFAKTRPEMQAWPLQIPMASYLNALCGFGQMTAKSCLTATLGPITGPRRTNPVNPAIRMLDD